MIQRSFGYAETGPGPKLGSSIACEMYASDEKLAGRSLVNKAASGYQARPVLRSRKLRDGGPRCFLDLQKRDGFDQPLTHVSGIRRFGLILRVAE